jgi:hypothetical protein
LEENSAKILDTIDAWFEYYHRAMQHVEKRLTLDVTQIIRDVRKQYEDVFKEMLDCVDAANEFEALK